MIDRRLFFKRSHYESCASHTREVREFADAELVSGVPANTVVSLEAVDLVIVVADRACVDVAIP
jgi:hypothetical protein